MSGLKPFRFSRTLGVICRSKRIEQPPLLQLVVVIEHVHVEPALRAHQRGKKTNRAGASHQAASSASRTASDGRCVRCDPMPWRQHSSARAILRRSRAAGSTLTRKSGSIRKNSEPKSVSLLDAALGVAAVATHIPFADGTGRTGNRVGPAHNADNDVAGFHPAAGRRVLHFTERLVAEHQPL